MWWECVFAWISEKGIWHKISQSIPKGTFWRVKFVIMIIWISIIIFANIRWAPPTILQTITGILLLILLNSPSRTVLLSLFGMRLTDIGSRSKITLPAETKLKSMFVCLFFKSQIWALVNVLGSLNLFCNGRGIFSFARHTVSVATSRFSSHSTKAAIDNTLMNGRVLCLNHTWFTDTKICF